MSGLTREGWSNLTLETKFQARIGAGKIPFLPCSADHKLDCTRLTMMSTHQQLVGLASSTQPEEPGEVVVYSTEESWGGENSTINLWESVFENDR